MLKLNSTGVNWVKNLPCYATILNEGAREELGWKSPFGIYYGRKSNAILNEQTESLSNNEMPVSKTFYTIKNKQRLVDNEEINILKTDIKSQKRTAKMKNICTTS